MRLKFLSRTTKQILKIPKKFLLTSAVFSVAALTLLGMTPHAYAIGTSRYVDPAGSDTTDCSTPASPCQTISYAVSQAIDGDTINIAAGTYDQAATIITIDKSLTFEGPNALVSPNGGSRIAEAIIQGDDATNLATFRVTSASAIVVFKGLEFNMNGPEMRSDVPGATITLQKNIFTGTKDGGTYFNDPNLTVDDNLFTNYDESCPTCSETIQMNATLPTVGTVSITNNTWNNITGDGALNLENLSGTISNNHFSHVEYYGILVAADSNLTISNNVFDHITNPNIPGSATWGAGIRFYAATPSTVASVTGNTFSNSYLGVSVRTGSDITGASIAVTGNTFSGNTSAILNAGTGTLNATSNYWGTAVLSTIQGLVNGDVTISPYFVDPLLATLNTVAPSTVYVNPAYVDGSAGGHIFGYDAFTTIPAAEAAVAPGGTVSVVSQVTGGQTTLTGSTPIGDVSVTIPAGTTVTASGSGTWDGIINPPTATTVSIPEIPGFTIAPGLGVAISVGSDNVTLTFDKGVRLVFPGLGSYHVGFLEPEPGSIFTEITSHCSSDSQVAGDALPAGGACWVNTAHGDLAVWTKHFSKFAAYFLNADSTSSPSSNSSGSSSSSSAASTPQQPSIPTYTVVSGDTLSGIGAQAGVDWHLIASLNGIVAPYTIYPGQVLQLPAGAVLTSASGSAAQSNGSGTAAGVLGESSNAQIGTPLSTSTSNLPAAVAAAVTPAAAQKASKFKWYWYVAIAAVLATIAAAYSLYRLADNKKKTT